MGGCSESTRVRRGPQLWPCERGLWRPAASDVGEGAAGGGVGGRQGGDRSGCVIAAMKTAVGSIVGGYSERGRGWRQRPRAAAAV